MLKKIETKFDTIKNQYYMLVGNDWQAITPYNIDIEIEKLGYIKKSKKEAQKND